MITASFARSARSRSFLRCGLQGCGSLSKGEHAMRSNLHDILLDEQGGTIRLEHVVPNLHVLCAALGIDEYEVCWHVSPQDKEPGGYVPFSSFRVRRMRTSRLT